MAHAYQITPADPRLGEAVTIHLSLGPQLAADRATCYYTIDGSDPAGQRGVAITGELVSSFAE